MKNTKKCIIIALILFFFLPVKGYPSDLTAQKKLHKEQNLISNNNADISRDIDYSNEAMRAKTGKINLSPMDKVADTSDFSNPDNKNIEEPPTSINDPKKINAELLKEKIALDLEIKRLREALLEKDEIISELKNQITILNKENIDWQIKHSDNPDIKKSTLDQTAKVSSSEQKNSTMNLFSLLSEQLKEEIAAGKIQVKMKKRNIQ